MSEKKEVVSFGHLMVDIETLGLGADAVVTQIAAVFFDPVTGSLGESWVSSVNVQDQLDRGRKVGASTLLWYYKQDLPLLGCEESDLLVFSVISDFSRWIEIHSGDVSKLQVWCKGPDFDFSILASLAGMVGEKMVWKYFNQRDVRTVVQLGRDSGADIESSAATHDALDDCRAQIRQVFQALRGIENLSCLGELRFPECRAQILYGSVLSMTNRRGSAPPWDALDEEEKEVWAELVVSYEKEVSCV